MTFFRRLITNFFFFWCGFAVIVTGFRIFSCGSLFAFFTLFANTAWLEVLSFIATQFSSKLGNLTGSDYYIKKRKKSVKFMFCKWLKGLSINCLKILKMCLLCSSVSDEASW